MNAPAKTGAGETEFNDRRDACRVAVFFEDGAAGDEALNVCRRLGLHFKDEPEFAIVSWRFQELRDPASGRAALDAAAFADIILFSTHGDFPREIRAWLEHFVDRRGEREGALALLLAEPLNLAAPFVALMSLFEQAAQRAGMDFLPLLPDSPENLSGETGQWAPAMAFSRWRTSQSASPRAGWNR